MKLKNIAMYACLLMLTTLVGAVAFAEDAKTTDAAASQLKTIPCPGGAGGAGAKVLPAEQSQSLPVDESTAGSAEKKK